MILLVYLVVLVLEKEFAINCAIFPINSDIVGLKNSFQFISTSMPSATRNVGMLRIRY
jgi:hypothetical protein